MIFEGHCDVVKRDPSDVLLTVGVNVVLVEHERDAKAILDRIPAERRAMVIAATPAQAAEMLGRYVDMGFGGFTMSNQTLPTHESNAMAGELIKLMRGARV